MLAGNEIGGGANVRLREERKRLGLSMRDLAAALRMSLKGYAKYETGERQLQQGRIQILAHLGFDVLYVHTGRREGTIPNLGACTDQALSVVPENVTLRDYWLMRGKLEHADEVIEKFVSRIETTLKTCEDQQSKTEQSTSENQEGKPKMSESENHLRGRDRSTSGGSA